MNKFKYTDILKSMKITKTNIVGYVSNNLLLHPFSDVYFNRKQDETTYSIHQPRKV
jgi:hypothetical protein